jgi:peroxin-11B
MRVGKFVEHFRAAAVASDAKSMDPVLKMLTVGRQLGYAAYMLADSVCVVSFHLHISPPPSTRTKEIKIS